MLRSTVCLTGKVLALSTYSNCSIAFLYADSFVASPKLDWNCVFQHLVHCLVAGVAEEARELYCERVTACCETKTVCYGGSERNAVDEGEHGEVDARDGQAEFTTDVIGAV